MKRNIRVSELASIYHMFLHSDWFNIPFYLEGVVLLCPVWYRMVVCILYLSACTEGMRHQHYNNNIPLKQKWSRERSALKLDIIYSAHTFVALHFFYVFFLFVSDCLEYVIRSGVKTD